MEPKVGFQKITYVLIRGLNIQVIEWKTKQKFMKNTIQFWIQNEV